MKWIQGPYGGFKTDKQRLAALRSRDLRLVLIELIKATKPLWAIPLLWILGLA